MDDFNDEISKEASRLLASRKIKVGLSLGFFVLLSIMAIIGGETLIGIVSLAVIIGLGWVIFNYSFPNSKILYKPGKGFWFYRVTPEKKIKILNYTQVITVIIFIIFFIFYLTSDLKGNYGAIKGLGAGAALIGTFGYVKTRITFHSKMDDATSFELEELGIIKMSEIPKALYKDFSSWKDLTKGNKIILTTQDTLRIIQMVSRNKANKIEIPLKEINHFNVTNYDQEGKGVLLSFGTVNNKIAQVILEGGSNQDSPEEFIRFFLEQLDEVLLRQRPISKSKNIRVVDEININHNQKNAEPITDTPANGRKLELTGISLKIEDKTEELLKPNQRYIDL